MNRSIRKDKEIEVELERFRMIDSPSEIYVQSKGVHTKDSVNIERLINQ